MKDPHVHVEKDIMFTTAMVRDVIVRATGVAVNAPKTVGTGCGKRRPYAATSTVPEKVTCVACRDHAATAHDEVASLTESLVDLARTDAVVAARTSPAELEAQAREERALAARFRQR